MSEPGTIRIERELSRPPALVWRAITEPALVAEWWAAGDIRAEVGHDFSLDMGPFGMQRCKVTEVEVGRLFVYEFGIGMLNTTISWRLQPNETGTSLEFEHAGFDVNSEMGRQALGGMSAGWPQILGRLAEVVDGLADAMPA